MSCGGCGAKPIGVPLLSAHGSRSRMGDRELMMLGTVMDFGQNETGKRQRRKPVM